MPKVSNTDKLSHIRMKKTVKILDTPELSVNTADLALAAVTLAPHHHHHHHHRV